MKTNIKMTTKELSKKVPTLSGIKKQIVKLKKKGIIKRIGADKGGHWEVVE